MDRAVFLDVLKDSYSAYYNIVPAETDDVPMIFRADYFSRDEKYWLTKSIKIWGNETNEFCYVFSAPEFDRKPWTPASSMHWMNRSRVSSRIRSTSIQT